MVKPGVSRLSAMQSPGKASRFKSFKRSLLSFVRSPTPKKEKPARQPQQQRPRRSFPTPATATSDCPTPVTTASTSTRRRHRKFGQSSDLPPPPFVDPSVGTPDVSEIWEEHVLDKSKRSSSSSSSPQTRQRKAQSKRHRVLKDGKLLYEWEQNSTHITLRLPQAWTTTTSSNTNSRYNQTSTDIKVLIAPSFLQVGIIHKKRNEKPRLEWKLHHTTGGTIHVPGSTWTPPEEHQMPDQGTVITLCKAKAGVHWPYALLHNPREEVQTKLCRPPRTKQRRPKKKQVSISEEEARVFAPPPPPIYETPSPPVQKKKKKKKVSAPSPSPNPRKKKRLSAIKKQQQQQPEQQEEEESDYFQEKQRSERRSGGEYSFCNVRNDDDDDPVKEPNNSSSSRLNSSSTRTHTTKPTSFSSQSEHPTSPRRSGGEYSMKPTSHTRLNIYQQDEDIREKPRRSNPEPSTPKFDIYEDQEAERRASAANLNSSFKRGSFFSKQSGGEQQQLSPKRFSKPTSRISMEIKSPNSSTQNNHHNSSSRLSVASFDKSNRSINTNMSRPSRVSMQLQQKRKSEGTTILVPSKASVMQRGETNTTTKKKKKKRASSKNTIESLDFVGHGKHESLDAAQHHKRTTLNAYLEKPDIPSNASDSQFKSVSTANTSKAMVQSTLQGWTASKRSSSNLSNPARRRSIEIEEDLPLDDPTKDDFFMHELEMSYSRMSTLL